MCVCMYVCMFARMHVYVYVYILVYVCMHAWVCVFVYTYMHVWCMEACIHVSHACINHTWTCPYRWSITHAHDVPYTHIPSLYACTVHIYIAFSMHVIYVYKMHLRNSSLFADHCSETTHFSTHFWWLMFPCFSKKKKRVDWKPPFPFFPARRGSGEEKAPIGISVGNKVVLVQCL